MVNKKKVSDLMEKAKEKGVIKTYKEFCKSDVSKETTLTKEEVTYYISKNKEEIN